MDGQWTVVQRNRGGRRVANPTRQVHFQQGPRRGMALLSPTGGGSLSLLFLTLTFIMDGQWMVLQSRQRRHVASPTHQVQFQRGPRRWMDSAFPAFSGRRGQSVFHNPNYTESEESHATKQEKDTWWKQKLTSQVDGMTALLKWRLHNLVAPCWLAEI